MLAQILPWNVHNLQHFVVELRWEWRVHTSQSLQNVRNTLTLKTKQVISGSDIAQIDSICNFVNT